MGKRTGSEATHTLSKFENGSTLEHLLYEAGWRPILNSAKALMGTSGWWPTGIERGNASRERRASTYTARERNSRAGAGWIAWRITAKKWLLRGWANRDRENRKHRHGRRPARFQPISRALSTLAVWNTTRRGYGPLWCLSRKTAEALSTGRAATQGKRLNESASHKKCKWLNRFRVHWVRRFRLWARWATLIAHRLTAFPLSSRAERALLKKLDCPLEALLDAIWDSVSERVWDFPVELTEKTLEEKGIL